jgi:hypothetical protein
MTRGDPPRCDTVHRRFDEKPAPNPTPAGRFAVKPAQSMSVLMCVRIDLTKTCSMRSLSDNRHDQDGNAHLGVVRMFASWRLVGRSSRPSKVICAMPSSMQAQGSGS